MPLNNNDPNLDLSRSINAAQPNPTTPKPASSANLENEAEQTAANLPDHQAADARPDASKIRELNDQLRRTLSGGRIMFTAGLVGRSAGFQSAVLNAVRVAEDFDEDNDPYGEHDFGCVELGAERILWKIDYYDPTLTFHSEDPADPARTVRVLTLMLAQEW